MTLFAYVQQAQRILDDQKEQVFNIADLTHYVNEARRRIAAKGQCVRVLPPSSGSLSALVVGSGGSGYTAPPTVSVSLPDAYGVGFTQATATATVAGGQVTGFTITNAGTGYVAQPTITLSGGGGTGATAVVTLTNFIQTVENQEVYKFTDYSSLIQTSNPGVDSIIAVQTIAVSWGSQKPVLDQTDWSGFQAYCRSINLASTNWPVVWAQYAQGALGSIYMFPIPAQTNQMDWDCYCLPSDLTSDASPEVIPYPWTAAIPYYAAYLAKMSKQDRDAAAFFYAQYDMRIKEARSMSSTATVPSFYGVY
jgi:hypothetical protein